MTAVFHNDTDGAHIFDGFQLFLLIFAVLTNWTMLNKELEHAWKEFIIGHKSTKIHSNEVLKTRKPDVRFSAFLRGN